MKKISGLIAYLNKELKYIFSRDDYIMNLSWDNVWSREKDRFPHRFNIINITLGLKKRKVSIADIGSGGGDLLKFLLEKNSITKESVGVDVSEFGVDRVQRLGLRGILADITDKNFKLEGQFDFITMIELIEHVRDGEEILLRLKPANRDGIIITTPNLGYIWFRLRLLFGRFPNVPHLPPREHIRFWTVIDFKIWSRQLGFNVISVKGCSGFPVLFKIWPSLFANDVLYWIVDNKKSN